MFAVLVPVHRRDAPGRAGGAAATAGGGRGAVLRRRIRRAGRSGAALAEPEALSYNSLALYLGLAAGPLIGQALLGLGGFPLAWIGASLLLVLAAVLAGRVPETLQTGLAPGPLPPLIHPAALVPGLGLFTGVAAVSGFLAFASLHAAHLGLDLWSTVLGLFGVVVVGCRILFAKLPDRVVPLRLAAAALATSGVGLVITAALPSAWGLFLGGRPLSVSAPPSSRRRSSRRSSAACLPRNTAAPLGPPACSSTSGSAEGPSWSGLSRRPSIFRLRSWPPQLSPLAGWSCWPSTRRQVHLPPRARQPPDTNRYPPGPGPFRPHADAYAELLIRRRRSPLAASRPPWGRRSRGTVRATREARLLRGRNRALTWGDGVGLGRLGFPTPSLSARTRASGCLQCVSLPASSTPTGAA